MIFILCNKLINYKILKYRMETHDEDEVELISTLSLADNNKNTKQDQININSVNLSTWRIEVISVIQNFEQDKKVNSKIY